MHIYELEPVKLYKFKSGGKNADLKSAYNNLIITAQMLKRELSDKSGPDPKAIYIAEGDCLDALKRIQKFLKRNQ